MTFTWSKLFNTWSLLALLGLGVNLTACQKSNTPQPFDPVKQAAIDDETIRNFLAKNNISATKTASGLYYIIDSINTSGAMAVAGKRVFVRYEGRFLDDAQTIFDHNLDNASDLTFIVGTGVVVKGFDEAVTLLRAGEQGRFFLPSGLAYGNKGASSIPPNTCIQFKLWLNNVE